MNQVEREPFFDKGVMVKNQVLSCNMIKLDFHPILRNRVDC